MRSSSSLWLSGLFVVFTATAAQACFVCDDVVELDAARANCFLARFDDWLGQMEQSQLDRIEIDFTDCTQGERGRSRGVDSFPVFPGYRAGSSDQVNQARNLRSTYILDQTGLVCLNGYLRQFQGDINPSITIDLAEVCP